MKLKIEDIVSSFQALGEMGSLPLPFQVSLDIAANVRAIKDVVLEYDKRRKEVFNEFAQVGKDDKKEISEKDRDAYLEKINAIVAEEIEIELKTIALEDMKTDGKLPNIAPNLLVPLEWMLDIKKKSKANRSTK